MEDRPTADAVSENRRRVVATRRPKRSEVTRRSSLRFGLRVATTWRSGTYQPKWWEQPFVQLGAALKTSFKLTKNPFQSPKTADEWEPYLRDKKVEHDALTRQLADAEAEINERVYRLFDLTKDEIALLQREVEH